MGKDITSINPANVDDNYFTKGLHMIINEVPYQGSLLGNCCHKIIQH